MSVAQIIYQLECGNFAKGPETMVSGFLPCAVCVDNCLITGVAVMEWRAKCHDCKFSRWAGRSRYTAGIFANEHWRRNSAHVVTVEYAENPTAKATLEKMRAFHGVRAES